MLNSYSPLFKSFALALWKQHILFHISLALATFGFLLYPTLTTVLKHNTSTQNFKLLIQKEQKLILSLQRQHNEYTSSWETLTSPHSLRQLSLQYLPAFSPIHTFDSLEDLPPLQHPPLQHHE